MILSDWYGVSKDYNPQDNEHDTTQILYLNCRLSEQELDKGLFRCLYVWLMYIYSNIWSHLITQWWSTDNVMLLDKPNRCLNYL